MVQLSKEAGANEAGAAIEPESASQEPSSSKSKIPSTQQLPQPPIAMGQDSVDSGALTEDSIAQLDLADQSTRDSLSSSAFTKPPPRYTESLSSEAAESGKDPSGVESANGESKHGEPNAPLPPNWQNARNAKSRRIGLAVAITLASLVSAAVLYGVLRRSSDTAVTAAKVTTPDPAESGTIEAADSIQDDADSSSVETAADAGTAADAAADSDSINSTVGDPNSSSTSVSDVQADVSTTPTDGDLSDGTQDSAANQSMSEPAIPSDLLPTNPLLPSGFLDNAAPGPSPLFDQNAKNPDGGNEEAPGWSKLPNDIMELLGPIDDLTRPHAAPTLKAPPSLDEVQLDRAANENIELETIVKPRKPINMRQALGMRFWLASPDEQGYPLNDLAMLISQWSRVPIQVEWVAFDIAGSPINQPVVLPNGWLNVEEILNRVCESVQAEMIQEAGMIRIQPNQESTAQSLERLLDLSDLASGSKDAVQLVRSLLRQQGGDTSVVSVPDNAGEAQLAALVCESVRRCRGEATKLPDQIAARWIGPLGKQAAAWPEVTEGVSVDSLLHPIPFAALLRRTANKNDATCFVNWADAAKRRIGPSDEQMPYTGKNVSASETLQQILKPESLQVRIADQQHWWVGSEASFDRLPVVIWFDDSSKDTSSQVAGDPKGNAAETMRKVEAVIGDAFGAKKHYANVAVDPASGRCIALLPRFIVRQLPRVMK